MTSSRSPDYLALLTAGADLALTAPQPEALLLDLAAAAASGTHRLTIHRAELVESSALLKIAAAAAGQVTLQFSHDDDPKPPTR